jgi:hypothetical protein
VFLRGGQPVAEARNNHRSGAARSGTRCDSLQPLLRLGTDTRLRETEARRETVRVSCETRPEAIEARSVKVCN